ncbi:PAS domain-containing sensor histidine kinase [Leptospira broomii]|uniref:PAS domain-containing sensor histidine kinase n=1 Tax=Leptospira broomii TaxID=301541 RepID=UPI000288B867|nr:PAS domain S-box protein [Leptospira broomii]
MKVRETSAGTPESVNGLDFFRTLVEKSRDMICLHDINGIYLYANPRAHELTGYNPSELVNRDSYDFIHPEDQEKIRRESHDLAKKGEVPPLSDYRFLHKKGVYVWLQTVTQPILDDSGKVKYLHTTTREITNQVSLTEKLKLEERFSCLMSELAHVGAWESDFQTGTIYWSSEVYRIFERDERKGIDKTAVYSYSHPDDLAIVSYCNKRLGETGESYSLEHRIITESGRIKWLRSQGKAIYVGDKITGIYGAIQDITLSKTVEEEIRLSEKKFSLAFHNSGIGIFLLDKDGRFLEVNQSFSNLVGYLPEELWVKKFSDITFSDDVDTGLEIFERVLGGEKESAQLVKRYVHKRGSLIWALVTSVAVRKDSGELMFVVAQVQDISRRRTLENILREKNSRLKSVGKNLRERLNQLEEFNQIVSHNIRSPIGNISTLVKFLEEAETEDEKKEFIEYLKQTASQLHSTLNELVEVIKIRQNARVTSEQISFDEIFAKVRSMFLGQIMEVGADIIVDFATAPEILYPRVYLESILLNLLSNALKYRSPKRKLVVTFRSHWQNNSLILEVADNGLGMDLNKYGNQIFKLHKTFHRNKEGKGLGLFMTKNQVESLGGEITVESELDRGTKFLVQLTKANEFWI